MKDLKLRLMLTATIAACGASAWAAPQDPNGAYWQGSESGYPTPSGSQEQFNGGSFVDVRTDRSGMAADGGAAAGLVRQGMMSLRANPRQAAALFERAALQGSADGALQLGVMLYNGEGMPRNPRDAYVWYTIAARGGQPQAVGYARDAAQELAPGDRAAADQRVQQVLARIQQGARRTATGQPNALPPIPNQGGPFAGASRSASPAGVTPQQATIATQPGAMSGAALQSPGPAASENARPAVRPTPGGPQDATAQFGQLANDPAGPIGNPGAGQAPAPAGPSNANVAGVETQDLGFFRVQKPAGWQFCPSGQGAEFSYVMRDPSNGARQAFVLASVGPLFANEQAKQYFGQLMQYSGTPFPWQQLPVIGELSPENFVTRFSQIARLPMVQQSFPQTPVLENLRVVSSQPEPKSPLNGMGGRVARIRATFTRNGQPCEGVFAVAVVPQPGFQGTGMAMCFVGLTAPAGELSQLEPVLTRCVQSGRFSPQYMAQIRQNQQMQFQAGQNRIRSQQAAFDGYQKAYRTQQETSDILMDTWKNTSHSQDRMGEMWTDSMRETERMYDPSSGQVYQFNQGFYDDHYDLNRNQYHMNNLQQLPYDEAHYDMLMQAPKDGYRELW